LQRSSGAAGRQPHQQSLAAVRAGNLAKLRDLLDNHGANLSSRNRIGESLLMMSIKASKQDIANYLLDCGARVDIASTANVTPLMAAAFHGDLGMVERLLERGADVHAVDRLKKTAMVYSAGEGRTEVVARLLKAGVDINARYPNDLTALMWAAGQGHTAAVKFLLGAGADAALADNRGKTALEIADEAGHLEAKISLTNP
jgi:ankyrin repeat protein